VVKKSDEAGLPDLQVAITKIGVMQRGAFVEKDVFSPSDTIVVKFDVSNTGTKAARGWTFSASLPANPVFTYNSDAQGRVKWGVFLVTKEGITALIDFLKEHNFKWDPKRRIDFFLPQDLRHYIENDNGRENLTVWWVR
jgi:hypothetical protein